jgi:hypothetical protein
VEKLKKDGQNSELNKEKIELTEESIAEAMRFVKRAKLTVVALKSEEYDSWNCPEWAATKRSAIDLGKELSKFNRKSR